MNLVELVGSGALASLWREFSDDVAYNTFKFLLELIDAPAACIPPPPLLLLQGNFDRCFSSFHFSIHDVILVEF